MKDYIIYSDLIYHIICEIIVCFVVNKNLM